MLAGLVTFVRYILAWFNTLFWCGLGCALVPVIGPSLAWIAIHRPWGHTTLRIVGIRLDVRGAEHLKQPAVFISNHQSLIDVVALPAIIPSASASSPSASCCSSHFGAGSLAWAARS